MAKLETCPYVLGILKKWNEIDYFFSQKFLHKTHTSSVTCKLDRNRVQIFRITNSPKKCRVIYIMCKYEISIPLRGCKKLAFFFLQKFTGANGSINLQSLTSAKWRKYGTLAKVKRMRIICNMIKNQFRKH